MGTGAEAAKAAELVTLSRDLGIALDEHPRRGLCGGRRCSSCRGDALPAWTRGWEQMLVQPTMRKAAVQRPRGHHPPHKCPHKRTLTGTTGRWLAPDSQTRPERAMTSDNDPTAGCSRCRRRRATTLITASGPADERSERPFPESAFPQVKVGSSGQGRGRTADLPLFRDSLSRRSLPLPGPGVRSACDISASPRRRGHRPHADSDTKRPGRRAQGGASGP